LPSDPQVPSPILEARVGQFGEGVLPSKSSVPFAHIGGLLLNTLESQIALFATFAKVTTFLYKDCENSLPPFVHLGTPPTPPKNFSKRNKGKRGTLKIIRLQGSWIL